MISKQFKHLKFKEEQIGGKENYWFLLNSDYIKRSFWQKIKYWLFKRKF